jgi:hypothetical protein
MVHAFFDESSHLTHQSEFICITGYISDDMGWESLANEWRILLKKHKLPFMHTSDFLAGEADYRNLKWPVEKRYEVLEEFIGVIRKHTLVGIGVGIDSASYRELTRDVQKPKKAHVFCFERIMRKVKDRLEKWEDNDPVAMVFDDVESYAMQCYSAFCKIKRAHPALKSTFTAISFADDKFVLPLQAADVLSCAINKERTFGSKAWSENYSRFRSLLKDGDPAYGKVYDSEYWDKDEMLKQKENFLKACSWASS